jgi:hypothetical protein
MNQLIPVARPPVDFTVLGKIERWEAEHRSLPQVEIPVEHYLAKGVYARQIFIPKGTIVTGKVHKYSAVEICLSGRISVLLADGGMKHIQAPFTFVSQPGSKKMAYTHEDTLWTTIHGIDNLSVSIEKLPDELTVGSYEEYLTFCRNSLQIEGN